MRFSKMALGLASVGLGIAAAAAGCGDDPPQQPPSSANCELKAECEVVDRDCLALFDNKDAKQFGLRMSQIVVSKPDSLAAATFVGKIVGGGVAYDKKECFLNGQGTFSWLLYADAEKGTICTGGAKPVTSPDEGYTFVKETITQGGKDFNVAPIEVPVDLSAPKIDSMTPLDVIVPVYTDPMDLTKVVLLPLKKARIFDAELSADHNCMGTFNAAELDPLNNCYPYPEENQFTFTTGGKLEGYITLEDADSVIVDLAGASLCKLITNQGNGEKPDKCARDANGKITYKGDWCDATNAAADATCADAVKLSAEFAASAVKVNGGCPLP
ncbi:hypothetical protein [Polyangium aurulentum]|uniref:hypothetical protein n=1 Tax=Polyangium aurulentum TaxID=2567896 RepID=UPI0010ADEF7C|nr:hypothetical protein [Polyangium aurulentum]UQA57960.1 hypothetical protein E8A73_042945 [Polyangium aurulentum]